MKKLLIIFSLIVLANEVSRASVSIINGLTHVYYGNSGEVIQGQIVLLNSSDRNQRVKFAINEALFSCDANRVFTEKNPHAQSSSDWFESETMERVLLPKEKYTYRFSIKVPANQSLKGSFWSVVMVYVENPIKEEVLNNNIGLNTKIRYAVGLLTHVNGFDTPNLDFEQVQVEKDTLIYNRVMDVKVKNDGAFIEGVKLFLEVYNASGDKVAVFETDRNLVFPNVCKSYMIDLSTLPPGEYKCLLLAESREEFTGTSIALSHK